MNKVPQHIGFICDGNDTWSKINGATQKDGYISGFNAVINTIKYAIEFGIEYTTFYLFSTENFSRNKLWLTNFKELAYHLLKTTILQELGGIGAKLRFIGDLSRFDDNISREIRYIEDASKNNKSIVVNLACGYGGRDEIVRCIRRLIDSRSYISEESISNNLDTAGIPDPDIILRTKGQQRLSNFMLWQSAYSEFIFLDKLWPDFCKKDLELAINEFNRRIRNFGKK